MRRFLGLMGALVATCWISGCGGNAASNSASNESASNESVDAASSSSNTATTSSDDTSGDKGKPITIAYSDWPGYVVWDIAEKQGFFKKHGANVELKWFPVYSDSLNALSAGQVDANSQTWNDALAPMAKGVGLKAVMMFDNSFGNDAMIAQPGINSVKDLKGKKVATELGTCDHFLMLKALESAGMTEKDIQFVPMAVQDCPTAMLSKRVDAAVVWEPSRTKILKEIKGSKQLFSSADIPGSIPDLLMMKSEVVASRPDDVQRIVDAWYDSVDWWRANPDKGAAIMAARTETPLNDYKAFMKGTRIFSAPEGLAAMTKSPKQTSLFTSGESVSKFLMAAEQIEKMPDYAAAVEPKFTKAAIAKGLGKMPPYNYPNKIL